MCPQQGSLTGKRLPVRLGGVLVGNYAKIGQSLCKNWTVIMQKLDSNYAKNEQFQNLEY
jgi:hypothetical protein